MLDGKRIKSIGVYLKDYQLLPYERSRELLDDLFNCPISSATLVNIAKDCATVLEDPVEVILQQIRHAPLVHFDETGLSVMARCQWLHVAATKGLTYYQIHPKRGCKAIDHIGILPNFSGLAVHDFWKPYLKYSCSHSLCNAHHLRELIFIQEQSGAAGQIWAEAMIDCLLYIKEQVEKARHRGQRSFSKRRLKEFEDYYQAMLDIGYDENPLPKTAVKTKGRIKKTKARNLLERLDTHRQKALAFMYNFNVPFDNNLAERDLRMAKLLQKISGTFRSQEGAHVFCRIRSYISTARKHGLNAIDAIADAFAGKPFVPSTGFT